LYTGEVARKNEKYEKTQEEHARTMKMMETKLSQFEQHNEKLVKQINAMNEQRLKYEEMRKENENLRTKIRFLEINNGMQARQSIGIGRPSTITQMNGAHLGMEDEAGEEFNNTYLKDLKSGGSEMSLDVFSTAEIQKRNSMYPQHMRGSYAMLGLDRTMGEQELKVRREGNGKVPVFIVLPPQDGGQFDDSHTALLQGARKKQTTSYRRPGPPTPSKMGGRLSIGGVSTEGNYQSVLKDSTNNLEPVKKTPSSNILRNMFGTSSTKVKDEVRMEISEMLG
jgi:hypothetical protein